MTIKKVIDKNYRQFFLNDEGKISVTKIGIQLAAAGAAVVAFPVSMAAVGVTVALPPIVILGAKWATGLGLFIAANRAKDTIDAGKIK